MRSRSLTLLLSLVVAVLVGGADGCSGDPNIEGARVALNDGDYDRALTNANEALATDPDNVDALTLKNDIYLRQYEAAPGAVAKRAFLSENFQKMASTVRRLDQLAPGTEGRTRTPSSTCGPRRSTRATTSLRADEALTPSSLSPTCRPRPSWLRTRPRAF